MNRLVVIFIFLSIGLSACNTATDSKESKHAMNNEDTLIENKKKAQKVELATLDKPYNPEADAKSDIDALVAQAKVENKNIIIQAGGNWCIWCLRFEKFRNENTEIKNTIATSYLYYHLNYSEENKNEEILKQYDNPGTLGYPVFIILNKNGEMLHVQGSEELEKDERNYDAEKVLGFLNKWKRRCGQK